MRILLVLTSVLTSVLLLSSPGQAGDSKADKIARAQSATHPEISHNATIMDVDGSVLKQGTNGWTCMPGVRPGDDHPMCNDAVWTKLMQAAGSGADFQTDRIGISYMLQGDMNISNSNPAATDPDNGDVWVQEGPHLMIVVPREMLVGLSDDPYNGGPYVMWKDTPYVHIMVPVRQ